MPVVLTSAIILAGVMIAGSTASIVSAVIVTGLAVASQFITKKNKSRPNGPENALTERALMIRRALVSRRLIYGRTRVGGIWAFADTTGPSNEYLHLVLIIGEGPIEGVETVYFNDKPIELDTNGEGLDEYTDFVRIKFHLGEQKTADLDLINESAKWTEQHILKGIAYAYVRLRYDAQKFRDGVPNISFVVKGLRNIYDPRSQSTTYTDNAALCMANYLTQSPMGPGVSMQEEIDQEQLIAAANLCDELLDKLPEGSSEKRYTANGVIPLDASPEENIIEFREAMAGNAVYSGGKWHIYPGAYQMPTFTITEDMIISSVSLQTRLPRRDRANRIKGTFISEPSSWQPTDFPAYEDKAFQKSDGEVLTKDLELTLVSSSSTAQRLAKIDLLRSRKYTEEIRLKCNIEALSVVAGKTVYLNFKRYHYEKTSFEVLESSLGGDEKGALFVDLVLRRIHPELYSWSAESDEKAI